MRPAIHVYRAIGVRPADVEDVDALEFLQFDELDAVGREERARDTRWLAARVRLELVDHAVGEYAAGPRLERHVLHVGFGDRTASGWEPHAVAIFRRRATEQYASFR